MIATCINFITFMLTLLLGRREQTTCVDLVPCSRVVANSPVARPPACISVERVSKTFESPDGRIAVLRNVTIAFEQGTFTAILGPSGCGKSTLLRIIAGLEKPDDSGGQIRIYGQPLLRDRARLREHLASMVSVITQSDTLGPSLTLEANVALPLLIQGEPPRSARQRARALLSALGLGEHMRKRPHQISDGQHLRVGIARATAQQSPILLADEPTAKLDAKMARRVFSMLASAAKESGQTVIVATHDEHLARDFAQRIFRVEDQQLVEDASSADQSMPLTTGNAESDTKRLPDELQRQWRVHRRAGIVRRTLKWLARRARSGYLQRRNRTCSPMTYRSRSLIALQHALHTWPTAIAMVAFAVFLASVPPLLTGSLSRALVQAIDRSIDQASVRRIIVYPAVGDSGGVFDAHWAEYWREQPGVAAAGGLIEENVLLRGPKQEPINAMLECASPDDPRFTVVPTDEEGLNGRPTAILPSGTANRLGVTGNNGGEVVLLLQRFVDGSRIDREVVLRIIATVDRSEGDRVYVSRATADAVESWLVDGVDGPTGQPTYRASIFADRVESVAPLVRQLEQAGYLTRHSLEAVGQVSAARAFVHGLANALSGAFAVAGVLGVLLYALANTRQNLRTAGVLRLLGARDLDVVCCLIAPPAFAAIVGFTFALAIAHVVTPGARGILEQAIGGLPLDHQGVFDLANLGWLLTIAVLTVGLVLAATLLLTLRACRAPILKALRAQA